MDEVELGVENQYRIIGASTADKTPQFYNCENTDMHRLALRSLVRPKFSSLRAVSQNIQAYEQSDLPSNLVSSALQTQSAQRSQVLTAAHSHIEFNLSTEVDGRTPLLRSLQSQQDTSFVRRIAANTIGLLAFAQIYVDMYNYYCVAGTLGAAVLLHYTVSSPAKQYDRTPVVREINLLKSGEVQLSFYGNQKDTVVPRQKFAFGYGKVNNFNESTAICVVDGKSFRLPKNRLVNNLKVSEFLH